MLLLMWYSIHTPSNGNMIVLVKPYTETSVIELDLRQMAFNWGTKLHQFLTKHFYFIEYIQVLPISLSPVSFIMFPL